jgi:hypothetical protein
MPRFGTIIVFLLFAALIGYGVWFVVHPSAPLAAR